MRHSSPMSEALNLYTSTWRSLAYQAPPLVTLLPLLRGEFTISSASDLRLMSVNYASVTKANSTHQNQSIWISNWRPYCERTARDRNCLKIKFVDSWLLTISFWSNLKIFHSFLITEISNVRRKTTFSNLNFKLVACERKLRDRKTYQT